MSEQVAQVTSQPQPLPDKKNESSPNFKFSNLPTSGPIEVKLSNNPSASNVSFVLWRNVNNAPDQEIRNSLGQTRSGQGSTYDASILSESNNYFIGDPEDASNASFMVTFYRT
jgi:hypothetical protein